MQANFVINIGRQVGSGGKRIGEILASRLNISLYDKELINLAAAESGFCPECFERADEHEQKGLLVALVGFFRTPMAGGYVQQNPLSNDSLFKIQSDVIRHLAERESCIFVGRCADYILREHPRTVNIFLTADTADRVQRIMKRTGWSEEEAIACVERTDAQRASYYNYYTTRRWGEASTYDLTINTSRLGDEATAELILAYIHRKLNL